MRKKKIIKSYPPVDVTLPENPLPPANKVLKAPESNKTEPKLKSPSTKHLSI